MNIVFFGTPDFAIPILEKIQLSKHNIVAIVTAPDKERGRGRQVSYTPVKEYAVNKSIKVFQPIKLNDEQFINELKELNADCYVVVAFRILPQSVYKMPPKGTFNLHGSLLPKYRGAAPIQWSLINGDKETGVTTFFLEDKVDTGNIIDFEKIIIEEKDNFGTLHDKMAKAGAELVVKTIDKIEQGQIILNKQDESKVSSAPKITKETCEIYWEKDSYSIHNLIRGLSPFPGAFFKKDDKIYKIYDSEYFSENKFLPGEIFTNKKEIFIGCGKGYLKIIELQPEGRKRMTSEDFLRGYKL